MKKRFLFPVLAMAVAMSCLACGCSGPVYDNDTPGVYETERPGPFAPLWLKVDHVSIGGGPGA